MHVINCVKECKKVYERSKEINLALTTKDLQMAKTTSNLFSIATIYDANPNKEADLVED